MHPIPDWTRREFVRGLGFGLPGLGLADVLARRAVAAPASALAGSLGGGKAKRCLMIFLFGGPAQSDTWDMKPEAPAEYRGEFQPIATSAPGVEWCEHLPKTARLAHHVSVVKSVSMTERAIGDHHADTYYVLTGHRPDRSFFTEGINRKPHEDDWPSIASTVAFAKGGLSDLPSVVQLPAKSGEVTNYINPGQFSGRLGPAYEAVLVRGELDKPRVLSVPAFQLPEETPAARVDQRRDLLARLDLWQRGVERASVQAKSGGAIESAWLTHRHKAFELLTSPRAKQAFDVSLESEETRRRYGEDVNGQSVLLARRLLEAGIPSVCVHWIGRRVGAGLSWDTHTDNFGQLKNVLLPAFDACFSALLEDLAARGLLDETIVLVVGEMGRTPKVGDPRNGASVAPGRDHWIHVFPALLAGGGIRGGQIYGSSDRIAAYPEDRPVNPSDLAATVYHAMGLEDRLTFVDRQNRPHQLLEEGEPLPLFG